MTTPITTPKHLALSALLAIAAMTALPAQAQELTCYTVRDSKGKIIDQTTEAPVDMSRPLSQTLPQKYGPGSTMIVGFSDFTSCSEKIASASTETSGFTGYTASSFGAASGYSGSSSGGSYGGGGYSGSYSPSSYGSYGTSSAGRYAVSSYHRNDGTYVRAHTRGYSGGGGGGRKR